VLTNVKVEYFYGQNCLAAFLCVPGNFAIILLVQDNISLGRSQNSILGHTLSIKALKETELVGSIVDFL
jgi:hypothetical protein